MTVTPELGEWAYLGTKVKVSVTPKKNRWYTTLYHNSVNLEVGTITAKDTRAAARVAVAQYILSGLYGPKVTAHLRVIKEIL